MAAIFGLLICAVAVLLTVVFSVFLRQHEQEQSATELYSIARNVADLMAESLLQRSRQVEVVSRSEILWQDGLSGQSVEQLLHRMQASDPASAWIGVADVSGVVRCSTGGLLLGQSVKERPWFAAGLAGTFVGDVHAAKLLASMLPKPKSGEPLRFLDFAAPIVVGGRTLGVIGVHGSWDWARQVTEKLLPFEAGNRQLQIFIFDRAGSIIYAPNGQTEALLASGQTVPVEIPRSDTTYRTPTPTIVQWKDGERYMTMGVRMDPRDAVSDLGWQIVVREPKDVALAPLVEAQRLSAMVGTGAALIACIVAWLAARRLSSDLYNVAAAAEQVDRGLAGAELPILKSSHEVMTLSTSLRRMTNRLLAANEEMERQVKLRTAELETVNRELDSLVQKDSLTGVLNRRGFDAQSARLVALARRTQRPLSVLMLDADHFKRINDAHGHQAGDEVLRSLAAAMKGRLRDSDLIARVGGEEFVALLPDADQDSALKVAESLRLHIAALSHLHAGQVTVSIGQATLEPDEELAHLLGRADDALYEAKGRGRNRVVAAGRLANDSTAKVGGLAVDSKEGTDCPHASRG